MNLLHKSRTVNSIRQTVSSIYIRIPYVFTAFVGNLLSSRCIARLACIRRLPVDGFVVVPVFPVVGVAVPVFPVDGVVVLTFPVDGVVVFPVDGVAFPPVGFVVLVLAAEPT